MPLTDELKESTRPAHQATEKKMVGALERLRSKADYIDLLYWLYGFYSPLEQRIGHHLTGKDLPWFMGERRSNALLRDIMESGLPLRQQQDCQQLPDIDSLPRALGALYVLEGSALGGPAIAEMIVRQLGLRDNLSFFNGERAPEQRWRLFKNYLNQLCFDDQREEILAAAHDTFITFKSWIEKNEFQPQL
jgi:heme oxygenase